MVSNRKIVISFDMDEVELRQNFGLNTEDALRTFHALCQLVIYFFEKYQGDQLPQLMYYI